MVKVNHSAFVIALAGAALLIGGCGDLDPSSTTGTTITEYVPGYVEGVVVASPACPVVGPGMPCPPRPIGDVTVEVSQGGTVVVTGKTDTDGRFRLACREGDAVVVASDDNGLGGEVSRKVVVTSGETTQVKLPLDIGIR